MNQVLPILIIYPIIVALLFWRRENKVSKILLYVSFVFLFIMTTLGSDYKGYESIFNLVKAGVPFSEIHGEKLFLVTMKLFSFLGLSYNVFRVVFLSVSLAIFMIYLNKMTPKFSVSFVLLMLGYISYMLSAYRQFMVMALILGAFYNMVYKKRYLSALIFSAVATLFHISGIIILGYVLVNNIIKTLHYQEKTIKAVSKNLSSNVLLYSIIALLIRILIYFICIIFNTEQFGSYFIVTLINAGLLSRTAILIVMCYAYKKIDYDPKLAMVFLFYVVCMLLYIALPFELLMGRLMNNARVLDIILIPRIYLTLKKRCKNCLYGNVSSSIANKFALFTIGVYSIMYVYQLLMQGGYYPYIHMLFGGRG